MVQSVRRDHLGRCPWRLRPPGKARRGMQEGPGVGRRPDCRDRTRRRRRPGQGSALVQRGALVTSAAGGDGTTCLRRRRVPASKSAGAAAAGWVLVRIGLGQDLPSAGGSAAAEAGAVGRAPRDSGEAHPSVPFAIPEHEAEHRGSPGCPRLEGARQVDPGAPVREELPEHCFEVRRRDSRHAGAGDARDVPVPGAQEEPVLVIGPPSAGGAVALPDALHE